MSDCSPHDNDFAVPGKEYGLSMTGTVHVAGRYINFIQQCQRCGRELLNHSKMNLPEKVKNKFKGFDVDSLVTEREVKLYDGSVHRAVTRGAAPGAKDCG